MNTTKLQRILQGHTAAILDRSKLPIQHGTGIFVKYNAVYFVLTAYHVIEGLKENDFLITLGITQRYPMKKERIGFIKHLDLAYIQLNEAEAVFLRGLNSEPFIIKQQNDNVSFEKYRHAINGFPFSKYLPDNNIQVVESYLIMTYFVEPKKWPEDIKPILINSDSLNEENNFILGYGDEAKSRDGIKAKAPEIRGMSGAGVWIFEPETEDSEKPMYQLYGIQTEWYNNKKYKLIRGSYLKPLIDSIKKDYNF